MGALVNVYMYVLHTQCVYKCTYVNATEVHMGMMEKIPLPKCGFAAQIELNLIMFYIICIPSMKSDYSRHECWFVN